MGTTVNRSCGSLKLRAAPIDDLAGLFHLVEHRLQTFSGPTGLPLFTCFLHKLQHALGRRPGAVKTFGRDIARPGPNDGVQNHFASLIVGPIPVEVTTGVGKSPSALGAVEGPGNRLGFTTLQGLAAFGSLPQDVLPDAPMAILKSARAFTKPRGLPWQEIGQYPYLKTQPTKEEIGQKK